MSDTKLLQAILDKVNVVDKKVNEVDKKVNEVDKKVNEVDKKVNEVKEEVKNTRESITKRIDKIGLQLARLEDDAPTIDEFEKLVRRVIKLEDRMLGN